MQNKVGATQGKEGRSGWLESRKQEGNLSELRDRNTKSIDIQQNFYL